MTSFHIQRRDYLESGIFGDASWGAVTLEHAYPQDGGTYKAKIPAGKGVWRRYHSPHFGFDVFRLYSVDGNTVSDDGQEFWDRAFETHIGNYNRDSDGCILIGKSRGGMLDGGKMICASSNAFNAWMASLAEVDEIEIQIEDM